MSSDEARPASRSQDPGDGERLDSWKEIAAYLKRDIRTLHRWEADEGLPIHRHVHKKRGTVYAYKSELEAWWNQKSRRLSESLPDAVPNWRFRWKLLLPLAGFLVLMAIGFVVGKNRVPRKSRHPGRVMLTVLPFENLGGGSEEDYFSDGLTEEVITQLASLDPPRLGVIARNSAMQYRGTTKDAHQIGVELGVDYILQGTVRRGGGRTRVTAELVQASDKTHLWAHSYEGDLRDVLAVQSDIARAIADQIHLRLGPEGSGKLAKTAPVDPGAYEAYLKGRYFWNKYTVEGAKKSIEYFQDATTRDPGFAQGYAGLADAYSVLAAFCYLPPSEAYPSSKAAAKKALEIDETQSEAHTQLGFVNMFYEHDWRGTEKQFRRAIELNPSNAIAHDGLATYFLIQGKFDDALAEMERAKHLDPVSLNIKADRGWYLFFARRPDQAISELQATLEFDPGFGVAHSDLGHAYEEKAMYGKAIREFQTAVAASPAHTCRLGALGHVYAVAGQKEAANQVLQQLQQMSLHRYVSPYHIALIYAGLGDQDQALSYLEKAYDDRFWMITFLGVDPRLDGMRSAPRFQKLLRQLAFPRD